MSLTRRRFFPLSASTIGASSLTARGFTEQLPSAEAVAGDGATLALDLLMAEDGYARAGSNPLLAI